MKMRICVLTTSFPLYQGVIAGSFLFEQTRCLVEMGVSVDIVAPHHAGAAHQETMEGIHIRRFQYMPEKQQTLCYGAGIAANMRTKRGAVLQVLPLLLGFAIKSLPYARQCDVIQANWSIAGLAGIVLGKLLHKPVVLVMYGAEVFVLKDNPVLRLPLKFVIKYADHVIAISRFTLEKTCEVQTPRAISLIPPGVDIHRFQRSADTAQVQQHLTVVGVDWAQPKIFAMGFFIERKGFKHLVDAIALLKDRCHVQLLLRGQGPLKESLQQQAVQLGVADRVFFLDYIPDNQMADYYTIADALASPAVVDSQGDTEGLGMTLLEAMACGTPCVASRVGGIVDIVKDGQNGFLVEPGNAQELAEKILLLCQNTDLRRQLGQQGRQFVEENFSWDDKAREILQVHQKVIRE